MVEGKAKTMKGTIVLGVFFLMLVTTYASFSHIVSYITEHSHELYPFEGEVALIVNYLAYLLGLSRASAIRNYKRQFQIAAICYAANYALYLFHFDHLLGLIASTLGALIGGYGASILWVSQGGYMMQLFKINSIPKDDEGYYLGIQNGMIYGSNIVGAIIITFGLGLLGNQMYFLILTGIGAIAFLHCTFFLDPLVTPSEKQRENQENQTKTSAFKEFSKSAKKVLQFYPKMWHMFAAMTLDGLMLGYMASYFSHIIPETIRSGLNVGIVLIMGGTGAILGGYFSGYLSDKIPPPKLGIAGFLFITLTLLLTLLAHYQPYQTLFYPCVLGFLWGLSIYFLQGWIFVCCTKVYMGKIETFAISKQIHTISFIAFQIYVILVNDQINNVGLLTVQIILALLSIASCYKMDSLAGQEKHVEMVEQGSPVE